MVLNIQDDILKLRSMRLLDKLLLDKTTKRRVMWATDAYTSFGPRYGRNEEITPELITGPNAGVIKTRARKEMEQQSSRTRQHGEVSTPLWVCEKMCAHFDEVWDSKVRWQKYVDARVLEITCGEAPFLVSRYDAETGEAIPISGRIGLLDRKLRVVNENTQTEEDWLNWTFRAFRATYGYEFQGDNLLISRVNLLMTFEEYLLDRWKRKPTISEYGRLITIIVWNIWQMDGRSGAIPYGTAEEEFQEIDWFGMLGSNTEKDVQPRCRIKNWLGDRSVEFHSLPIVGGNHAMKFDFIIGNPPYQEEASGDNKDFAPPIYHKFIEEAYKICDVVELIHPARFLFNAGNTPKAWNEKMLHDPHLKVLWFEQDSGKVFANTYITGGVAVTYRDARQDFGCIETFTSFPELNTILRKVSQRAESESLMNIIYNQLRFDLKALYKEYPQFASVIGSEGRDKRFRNNIFEKIPLFTVEKTNNDDIPVIGVVNGKREWRYISQKFVDAAHESLWKYKVILSAANGASGTLGKEPARITTVPFLGEPGVGYTQTFISLGAFKTKREATALLKYVKSKFARTLLGILKVTQDNKKPMWKLVPLQNFTSASDIDWSRPIPEIDQQLYAKYGLDENEIQFIETHVKEMV